MMLKMAYLAKKGIFLAGLFKRDIVLKNAKKMLKNF